MTSSYDLTLDWEAFKAAKELNYFVDAENIKDVNNRYDKSSKSLKETTAAITYKELVWKDAAAVKPTNDNAIQGDNRSDKAVYPAVQGQALKIALSSSEDNVVAPTNIRAIYVVLDKQNAVESAPSELNAWNSYTYTGLNTVVEGTSTEITIDSKSAINDIIGFRVFAVNYDGTLVDPDGKAFYVAVGDIDAMTTTLKADYVPVWNAPDGDYERDVEIDLDEELLKLFEDKYNEYEEGNLIFDIENNPNDNENFVKNFDRQEGKLVISLKGNLNKFKDNGTYKMYFNFTDSKKNVIVKKVAIEITKKMPEFPAAFSAKANQLDKEGAKVVEVTEANWNTTIHNLGTAFNGVSDPTNAIIDFNYTFTCAEKQIVFYSDKASAARYGFYLDVNNDKDKAAALFADKPEGKMYDVTVSYKYSNVSSETADYSYTVKAPAAQNFKLRLVCGEGFTSEWKNFDDKKNPIKESLIYNVSETRIALANILKFKKGDIDYTPTFVAANIKECHLASNNVDDEYFTVTFDAVTQEFVFVSRLGQNPPTSDVIATLKFTMVDFFGHENPEEYPYFVIKK